MNAKVKKRRRSPLQELRSWTYGDSAALLRKVGGSQKGRRILSGDLTVRLTRSRTIPQTKRMFLTPEDQLWKWKRWLPMLHDWLGVTARLEGESVECPTLWRSETNFHVPILTLLGPTAWQEFRLYWPLIAGQHKWSERSGEIVFEEGCIDWVPAARNDSRLNWEFRWQLIDLGANKDKSASDVCAHVSERCLRVPSAGILAAAALHDGWIRRMDGDKVNYVNLSGYRYKSNPQHVPYLSYDPKMQSVQLFGVADSVASRAFGCPVFVNRQTLGLV